MGLAAASIRRRRRGRERDAVAHGQAGVAPGLLHEPDRSRARPSTSSSGVTSMSSTTTPVPPVSAALGALVGRHERQPVLAAAAAVTAGHDAVAVLASRRP